MKIHFEHNGTSFTFERHQMEPERFQRMCNLAFAAVGGGVLLGAIHLVGFWAIPWAVGALALIGLYKIVKEGF